MLTPEDCTGKEKCMEIIRYPSEKAVNEAVREDQMLMAAIFTDRSAAVVCPLKDVSDHSSLLMCAGFSPGDADNCFRILFSSASADWQFMCPRSYKDNTDRESALGEFYRDGLAVIPEFLTLMGYFTQIKIKNLTGEIWDF
ncbi:MAG TPA: hypothetical protein DCZ71_07700 [Ruminococcus sp.]|nr:hypothetical protein [Ruminococcus sp.]